jgi:hypothetical protein
MSESAPFRKAAATLISAGRFFRDHRPIPAALCARQSGDTSKRLEPHAEQTKRFNLAMFGKGVSGARPIPAKAKGVDRRQIGLRHVTHAPATPCDWRSAIVGGAMGMGEGAGLKNRRSGIPRICAFRFRLASPALEGKRSL